MHAASRKPHLHPPKGLMLKRHTRLLRAEPISSGVVACRREPASVKSLNLSFTGSMHLSFRVSRFLGEFVLTTQRPETRTVAHQVGRVLPSSHFRCIVIRASHCSCGLPISMFGSMNLIQSQTPAWALGTPNRPTCSP